MKPTLSCIIGMRKDIIFSRNFQHSIHLLHTAKQQREASLLMLGNAVTPFMMVTLSKQLEQ